MFWHILRKDWKLLRWMVVGLALLNAVPRIVQSSYGAFWDNRRAAAGFTGMLYGVALAAGVLVIVLAVQEDAIPGLRQDWLARPIARRDLLLSKLLFVVLLVQAPIFAIEVAQCLAAGFPLAASFSAPFSRSLWMLLALDLPVLAFATLTRNLAQAAAAAVAAILGVACFFLCAELVFATDVEGDQTWVHVAVQAAWGIAAAAAILALQYYRRKTPHARSAFAAAMAVWLALELIPWNTAFAIEARLSPQPSAANPIRMVFLPGAGRRRRSPDERFQRIPAWRGHPTNDLDLYVPLGIDGLSPDRMLLGDRAAIRLTDSTGRVVYTGDQGVTIPFVRLPLIPGLEGPVYQLVVVSRDVYERLKDQPLNLEIDFTLTLLRASAPQTLPPAGSSRWLEGVGRCATRISRLDGMEVGCQSPGQGSLVLWAAQDDQGLPVNLNSFGDSPDSAPFFARIYGDSISRYRPNKQPDLPLAYQMVTVRSYRAEAQFARRLTIPNLRLSDWQAE